MGTSYSLNIVVARRTCGSTRCGVQDWRLSMKYGAKEMLALKITSESYLRGARDVFGFLSFRSCAAGSTSNVKEYPVTIKRQSV